MRVSCLFYSHLFVIEVGRLLRLRQLISPVNVPSYSARASTCHNGETAGEPHGIFWQSKNNINRTHDRRLREGRMRVVICRQNDTLNNRIKFNEAMNGLTFEYFQRLFGGVK